MAILHNIGSVNARPRNVGAVPLDPNIVINAAASLWSAVSSIFGGGDQSPNYPIKSANTEKKLKAEVAANIPFPPTSIAQANQLIQRAQQLKIENEKRDNSDRVIKSIQMMYDEAIAALSAWIQAQGGTPQVPAGSGLPAVQQAVQEYGTKDNSGKIFGLPPLALAGGAAAAVFFLMRKKSRKVSGMSTESILLLAGLGVGAYLLLKKKNEQAPIVAPELPEADQVREPVTLPAAEDPAEYENDVPAVYVPQAAILPADPAAQWVDVPQVKQKLVDILGSEVQVSEY